MRSEIAYFFDSYAILEVAQGGENYRKYANALVLTTKLNLFEVAHSLSKKGALKEAEFLLDEYYDAVLDFNKTVIKEAVLFKLEHKKKNLSLVDCIGYVLAKYLQIKFLTGDEGFRNLENVEFVK